MKKFKPGISFSDFVISDSSKSRSKIEDRVPNDYRRGWLVWIFVVIGFGFIGVRLISMQLIEGDEYKVLSDENRIKKIKIIAPRGRILDRNGLTLAGNLIDGKIIREYPHGQAGAHLVGYLGEVSEDEVGLLKEKGEKYDAGDLIGRSGLEALYEYRLRGIDGGRLVEVDNVGQVSRELGVQNPQPGQDVIVSLDVKLSEESVKAIDGKKGAVVVSNPKTGEILSMISSPSFDPNTLSTQYSSLSTHSDLPLFNRAIGGVYPPGSTFKMVTTLAAIESGKVDTNFTYEDKGVIKVGIFSYSNWLFSKSGGVEGVVGFSRALSRSTDTFFYTVGELTTPGEIAKWAKMMGFGQKTGFEAYGEVEGLIPDPEWKLRFKNENWFLGDTYITAIGQGDILTTPLQINQMTNILATGGKKCKPTLNQNPNNDQCLNIQISKESLDIIKKGMVGACSIGGTGFVFFDWNSKENYPKVACKTGTAEFTAVNGKMRTHALFTAFAPADDPQISVTVVIEGGGEGSNVAAPIARKVMAKYFGVEDKYPYGSIRQISE
jgi:penicillin-binding protein 2